MNRYPQDSNKTSRPQSGRVLSRRASITTEAVMSIIILAAATAVVSRFAATFYSGLNDRQLAAQVGVEISNARELIGSWPLRKVTEENIAALQVEGLLSERLENARWEAEIVDIEEPLPLRQVTLNLVCEYEGQQATPETLTFWVRIDPDSQASSETEGEEQ